MNEALQNIITYAYNKVPYYKKLFDTNKINPIDIIDCEHLKNIPFTSKKTIQLMPNEFRSIDYLEDKKLFKVRTSGSTGRVLNIFWRKQDYSRSLFYLWCIRNRVYGVSPQSKFCSFYSTLYKNNSLLDANKNIIINHGLNLSFNKLTMDDSHLLSYYNEMNNFKPSWLFLQPSIAFQFSRFMLENKLTPPQSIKYIELNGEYVSENYKNTIQSAFKIPVTNMYGCEEAQAIAIECPHGKLHCISNNVIVEAIKNDELAKFGEEGEACITSLNNQAMPFIRYKLGDRIVLYPSSTCTCGNKNPVIEIKNGRIGQYIITEDNKHINSFLLVYVIERINKVMENSILQFKVIQHTYRNLTAFLIINKPFLNKKEVIADLFKNEALNIGLNNIDWEFVFADRILPYKLQGKLQFFYSEL